jgi:hypothetical protein
LIAAAAVGAVVLVVGGIVVYKATRPKPDAAANATGDREKTPTVREQILGIPTGTVPAEPQLLPEPALLDGWNRFTLKEVNLSLHLPGQPSRPSEAESDMLRTRVKDFQYSYEVPDRGGSYDLLVMIIPPGTTIHADEQAVFRRLPRHTFERRGKGRIVSEKSTTIAGSTATELECELPDKATVTCRYGFVQAGGQSMFVIATAGGPKVAPADREAFLNSIRPAGK